jgi:hypothetical protein
MKVDGDGATCSGSGSEKKTHNSGQNYTFREGY